MGCYQALLSLIINAWPALKQSQFDLQPPQRVDCRDFQTFPLALLLKPTTHVLVSTPFLCWSSDAANVVVLQLTSAASAAAQALVRLLAYDVHNCGIRCRYCRNRSYCRC